MLLVFFEWWLLDGVEYFDECVWVDDFEFFDYGGKQCFICVDDDFIVDFECCGEYFFVFLLVFVSWDFGNVFDGCCQKIQRCCEVMQSCWWVFFEMMLDFFVGQEMVEFFQD